MLNSSFYLENCCSGFSSLVRTPYLWLPVTCLTPLSTILFFSSPGILYKSHTFPPQDLVVYSNVNSVFTPFIADIFSKYISWLTAKYRNSTPRYLILLPHLSLLTLKTIQHDKISFYHFLYFYLVKQEFQKIMSVSSPTLNGISTHPFLKGSEGWRLTMMQ